MYVENLDGDLGDIWQGVKTGVKDVVSIPGKIVAANLQPIEKSVSQTVSDVGTGAGVAVSKVTNSLIPILVLALIGGYIYFNSKKVSVNVNNSRE